jgi:hypothetical protein
VLSWRDTDMLKSDLDVIASRAQSGAQWMEDCWHGSYNGAPNDGSAWTTEKVAASSAARLQVHPELILSEANPPIVVTFAELLLFELINCTEKEDRRSGWLCRSCWAISHLGHRTARRSHIFALLCLALPIALPMLGRGRQLILRDLPLHEGGCHGRIEPQPFTGIATRSN